MQWPAAAWYNRPEEQMSQSALERLVKLASENLPPDASAEQLIGWTVDFFTTVGASELMGQIEFSLENEVDCYENC
jgi:hypothetical protein